MHERLKAATEIGRANCETCCRLRHESDGDYAQYRWSICDKIPGRANLRSFPFQTEQRCWEPDFWSSAMAMDPHEDILVVLRRFDDRVANVIPEE